MTTTSSTTQPISLDSLHHELNKAVAGLMHDLVKCHSNGEHSVLVTRADVLKEVAQRLPSEVYCLQRTLKRTRADENEGMADAHQEALT